MSVFGGGNCWEEQLPRRLDIRREGRVGFDERPGDDRAHVEVVKFAVPAATGGIHRAADPVQESVFAQPEAEPGLGVLLGEPACAQQDGQHGEPHMADGASEQRPGGGHGPFADAARTDLQLPQGVPDFRRQPAGDESAGRGAVVELRILPEVRQHLEQVRLAASKETAHPHGVLAGRVEVRQVPLQHPLQRVGETAGADERLELGAQLAHHSRVGPAGDSGLAVVGQSDLKRIAVEELVDLHSWRLGLAEGVRVSRAPTAPRRRGA